MAFDKFPLGTVMNAWNWSNIIGTFNKYIYVKRLLDLVLRTHTQICLVCFPLSFYSEASKDFKGSEGYVFHYWILTDLWRLLLRGIRSISVNILHSSATSRFWLRASWPSANLPRWISWNFRTKLFFTINIISMVLFWGSWFPSGQVKNEVTRPDGQVEF